MDRKQYHHQWYNKNRERLRGIKAWRQKHDLVYRLRSILRTIQQRCEDPRHASYKWYGGRGIQNFLTFDDVRFMWERDGAGKMAKPSIDREDRDDDYTFDNCCFRELKDNQQRAWAIRRKGSHEETDRRL